MKSSQHHEFLRGTTLAALRRRLLAWYRVHHRRLPWRAEPPGVPDPYHVLVSEAMLQQTQVATVVAYFHRFVDAFPGIEALAAAQEHDVLVQWQGLGYYRRAKHLHAAARHIVTHHGGKIPDDPAAIAELPGVGRYTAGAIASIAFEKPEPILDGNVARVLARWFAIEEPADAPATRARLWALATRLVPAAHPGDFNQAMMELGALVCLPRNPRCEACPMAAICRAKQLGLTETIPRRLARRAPRRVEHHVVAIRRGEEFLFEQRPAKGLWASMWQLPTAERLGDGAAPRRVRAWVKDHVGMAVGSPAEIAVYPHATTHRSVSVRLWVAEVSRGAEPGPPAGSELPLRRTWRGLDRIDDLPVSNLQKRAVALLLASVRDIFAGKR